MLERGELDGVRLRGGETQEFRKQGGGGGIPPNPPAGGGGWGSRDEVHLGVRVRGRPDNGPSGGGGELAGHTPVRGVGHMVSWPASGRHTLGAILRSPGGAGSGQGVWRPRPSGGIPAAARKHDTLVDGPERGAGGGGFDGEAYDAGGDARGDENTRDGGGGKSGERGLDLSDGSRDEGFHRGGNELPGTRDTDGESLHGAVGGKTTASGTPVHGRGDGIVRRPRVGGRRRREGGGPRRAEPGPNPEGGRTKGRGGSPGVELGRVGGC